MAEVGIGTAAAAGIAVVDAGGGCGRGRVGSKRPVGLLAQRWDVVAWWRGRKQLLGEEGQLEEDHYWREGRRAKWADAAVGVAAGTGQGEEGSLHRPDVEVGRSPEPPRGGPGRRPSW